MIALIPARSGSKRITDKNILQMWGHPLMAYTIDLAKRSNLFSEVYVTSDSIEYLAIADFYGAKTIKRPESKAEDLSPDQEWIDHAFSLIGEQDYTILRPTNPFRTIDYLTEGIEIFNNNQNIDHVRAVEAVSQHPYKMWQKPHSGAEITPYLMQNKHYTEQSSTFPTVYVQNGSLEVRRVGPNSGAIYPVFAKNYEGFDINTIEDILLADALVKSNIQEKPTIEGEPWKKKSLYLV